MSLTDIKKEMCEVGRRVYQNGFGAANDGNFTVKINEKEFLTTPTGVSKGFMNPDMIIKVDNDGNLLEGSLKPSSEIKMHLKVYQMRKDVNAVVHAHPPFATGFAIAGIPLDKFVMPESILSLGSVPIAPYGTPSTDEIADSIKDYLSEHDALLLKNHGALTVGKDLMTAYFKMETTEFYAKLLFISRVLGNVNEIPPNKLEDLMNIREKYNLTGNHPGLKKYS